MEQLELKKNLSSSDVADASARQNSLETLTFFVGESEYGIDIMTVHEIKGWTGTTRLPNSPRYVRGVMNLRGLVIPIFDLRSKFMGSFTEVTSKHVVVVLSVGSKIIGILVDSVSDILSVTKEHIKPSPSQSEHGLHDSFVKGLIAVTDAVKEKAVNAIKKHNRMVVLLDVASLFSEEIHELTEDGKL